MSNVIAIASLVSEILLATERHIHTHRYGLGFFRKVFKVNDFAARKPADD